MHRSSQMTSVAAEVRNHREGDRMATEALARRATGLALRTATAILESREEAADVAQDVAVDVLTSLGKLRDPDSFDAWVHRITARHALRRLRRRRAAGRIETPIDLLDSESEPTAPEGVDRAAVLAARQELASALATLPAKQQVALALRYVHDLPDEEIAAALRCRTGTVHSLLSRARTRLRQDTRLAELALAFQGGRQ
jgi:RNA polymerase sigma-70 factor (ECF subfamily)